MVNITSVKLNSSYKEKGVLSCPPYATRVPSRCLQELCQTGMVARCPPGGVYRVWQVSRPPVSP